VHLDATCFGAEDLEVPYRVPHRLEDFVDDVTQEHPRALVCEGFQVPEGTGDEAFVHQSNAEAIEKLLDEHPLLKYGRDFIHPSSGGMGWSGYGSYMQLAFVITEDSRTMEPTLAFSIIAGIMDSLEEYPVLDEEDLSRREYEDLHEAVREEFYEYADDPDDTQEWVHLIIDSGDWSRREDMHYGLGPAADHTRIINLLRENGMLDFEYVLDHDFLSPRELTADEWRQSGLDPLDYDVDPAYAFDLDESEEDEED
jgi:hypothetical protein